VVLVLAVDREAPRPALLQARELLVAEVPASRPLQQVAAHRAEVADLRRADFAGRLRQGAILAPYPRMGLEVDEPGGGADPEAAFRQVGDRGVEAPHADDAVGRGDVVLHQPDEVHAAGERHRTAALGVERGDRLLHRRGIHVSERLHCVPPVRAASSATSTLRGVMGRLRTRTPVALATALAIAAAVEMVGGSPMPMTPRSGWFSSTTSICGISLGPGSRYHSMFGLTMVAVLRSRIRSSNRA